MKSEFTFIQSEGWRSWQRIFSTNVAFASSFAYFGGVEAALPFALNLIKGATSRILADYDIIETKYQYLAAELITSTIVIAVAAVALTVFTPMTATTAFYSALPMLAETLYVQFSAEESITDDEQRERYKKCCRAHA